MGISIKIILSLVIIVAGVIIAGVIRDLVGVGQYIISGVIVVVLFYAWGDYSSEKTSIREEGND